MHGTPDQASKYGAVSLKSCTAANQDADAAKDSQVPHPVNV